MSAKKHLATLPETGKGQFHPQEYTITALRDCLSLNEGSLCDTPELVWKYWKVNIASAPAFNPEVEQLVVLLLNTRRQVKGHLVLSVGTMDTTLFHPREAFRAAIIGAASGVVFIHNHPSGDPSPSTGDIKVTREMVKAGLLLRMEVLDHVIVGANGYFSFRGAKLLGSKAASHESGSRKARAERESAGWIKFNIGGGQVRRLRAMAECQGISLQQFLRDAVRSRYVEKQIEMGVVGQGPEKWTRKRRKASAAVFKMTRTFLLNGRWPLNN